MGSGGLSKHGEVIIQLIYIAFCLALAWYNYRRILFDKRIYHGINGALHLAFWGVVVIITKSWFPVVVLPFLGRVFFDAALNAMRRLPLNYVAKNPKSIVDKVEKSVFGNDGILPKVVYLGLAIALNIIYYA